MRQTNEEPIGDIVQNWINALGYKSTLNELRIREIWKQVVGESASEQTQKIKLDKNKLTIFVPSAILRNELIYQKEKIRCAVNAQLGEELIQEVSIS